MRWLGAIFVFVCIVGVNEASACKAKYRPIIKVAPEFSLDLQSELLITSNLQGWLRGESGDIPFSTNAQGVAHLANVPDGKYSVAVPIGYVLEEIKVNRSSQRRSTKFRIIEPSLIQAKELKGTFDTSRDFWLPVKPTYAYRFYSLRGAQPDQLSPFETVSNEFEFKQAPAGLYLLEVTSGEFKDHVLVEITSNAKDPALTLVKTHSICGPAWRRETKSDIKYRQQMQKRMGLAASH